MKSLISKNSSGRSVLFFSLAAGLAYLIMVFVTIPRVMLFAQGMKPLDLLPGGYSFEYVTLLFKMLGEEGRHAYLLYQIPVDLIFPLLFAASCTLLIAFLLKKLNRFNSSLYYLCLVPFAGGITDYFENFGIIALLNQYPDISAAIVKATSFFTVIKFASISVTFIAIIALLFTFWFGAKKG